jgi:hypothetical protein
MLEASCLEAGDLIGAMALHSARIDARCVQRFASTLMCGITKVAPCV